MAARCGCSPGALNPAPPLRAGQADEEWEAYLNQGWDRAAAAAAAASHPELTLQRDSEQRPHKISYKLRWAGWGVLWWAGSLLGRWRMPACWKGCKAGGMGPTGAARQLAAHTPPIACHHDWALQRGRPRARAGRAARRAGGRRPRLQRHLLGWVR